MPVIETFGEVLPGLLMEKVVDPRRPECLLLHTWDGSKPTTVEKVEYKDLTYVSARLKSGLGASVRFPPPSKDFKSTKELISRIRDVLSKYGNLHRKDTDLLITFGVATWFCDFMPSAPILYLSGSEEATSQVLRVLACFCRRPALLAAVDFSGLSTMPNRLAATLLINQRGLGRRVAHILSVSNRRHFDLIHGKTRLDLYGPKAFLSEGSAERGLTVLVPPPRGSLLVMKDLEEALIAQDLQSKLLRYRMLYYDKVREVSVDTSTIVPDMQQVAQSWLAPIVDFPEFADEVHGEILRRSEESASSRFVDFTSVVIEAAFFLGHQSPLKYFQVGELAQVANDILRGRHGEAELSDKRAGSILREVGIYGIRVATGYRVTLNEAVRRRIHELAVDYSIPTLDDIKVRCDYCQQTKVYREKIV
jgi:hypothetical protein